MNKRQIGTEYEELACGYLKNHGMKILERNYRIRQGEIDIIGYHDRCLVFVEVKYRKDDRMGNPSEAVHMQKQRIICRVSDHYRFYHGVGEDRRIRFDVISVCGTELRWYKNAFEYSL